MPALSSARFLAGILLAALVLGSHVPGQRTPRGGAAGSAGGGAAGRAVERDVDPYTKFEEDRLAQLGYVATAAAGRSWCIRVVW